MSTSQSSEVFRPVPGQPSHRVSDLGRVQHAKTPGRKRADLDNCVWVDSAAQRANSGYLFVRLRAGKRSRTAYVHRLVLLAFVGPCPPGMQARHVALTRFSDLIRNPHF